MILFEYTGITAKLPKRAAIGLNHAVFERMVPCMGWKKRLIFCPREGTDQIRALSPASQSTAFTSSTPFSSFAMVLSMDSRMRG